MNDDHQQPTKHTPLQQGASPVSGAVNPSGKEAEPIIGGTRAGEVVNAEPTNEKPISPEVSKYLEQHDKSINLPKAMQAIGATKGHDEQIDMSEFGPHFDMSDEQIENAMHEPLTSSTRWLATLLLYLMQQSHYTIKVVKGHVKRIFKP